MFKTLLAVMFVMSFTTPCIASRKIRLTDTNTVIFNQEINPASADNILAALSGKRILSPESEPLYLLIVSGGGEYQSGKVLLSIVSNTSNIHIICKYCASAAGMVFAAAPGPRLVVQKSVLLMHEMYIEHMTSFLVQRKEVVSNLIENSLEFDKTMYSIIGISKSDYEKKIRGTEWSVKGAEIVKLKLANELVIIECSPYVARMVPDTCSN